MDVWKVETQTKIGLRMTALGKPGITSIVESMILWACIEKTC